jgi:pimeloyl-ACP methyl ester carboxylesterase
VSRFVLVHGAWHGAWCWEHVATGLRSRGHAVETPTLAGVGERAGELTPDLGLAAHVGDVERAIVTGGPCVLVGHSYAGIVAREAADRAPGAVERVVLVDGWAGADGASLFSLAPDWFVDGLRRAATAGGDGWRMPAPPPLLVGVSDPAQGEWLAARLTAHPLRTFEEPTSLSGAVDALPGVAVVCRPGAGLPFAEMAAAIGYRTVDLQSGHDAMVVAPDALVEVLDREGA